VQVVFKVLSALMTSMTIKDSENLNFRPIICSISFLLRLDNIENNGNAIFIHFANCANIGISSERSNTTKSLSTSFTHLKERQRR
jgi:hypothetical protein